LTRLAQSPLDLPPRIGGGKVRKGERGLKGEKGEKGSHIGPFVYLLSCPLSRGTKGRRREKRRSSERKEAGEEEREKVSVRIESLSVHRGGREMKKIGDRESSDHRRKKIRGKARKGEGEKKGKKRTMKIPARSNLSISSF